MLAVEGRQYITVSISGLGTRVTLFSMPRTIFQFYFPVVFNWRCKRNACVGRRKAIMITVS